MLLRRLLGNAGMGLVTGKIAAFPPSGAVTATEGGEVTRAAEAALDMGEGVGLLVGRTKR